MALKTRNELKAYFETNDFPTEQEFINLIDSVPNFTTDGPAITYAAKLLIATADVLNLNTVPVDFIASPGANKIIQIIAASVFLDWNSVIYANNLSVDFLTDTATVQQYFHSLILSAAVDTTIIATPRILAPIANTQLIPDKKIVITNIIGDPINGDSNITCYALYQILDI